MGYEQPFSTLGEYPSDADRRSLVNQYTFVDLTTSSTIVGAGVGNAVLTACTAGGRAIGILQNNPPLGAAGTVYAKGVSMARAGGTFSAGDDISSDGNGYAVKASGNVVLARALESAVSGDITTVLLH